VSGFTLPDTLPVVAGVEALTGACAVLTLADGSQVMVSPSDRASLTPDSSEGVGLVTRWDKGPEGSNLYRVPAVLSGRVAWALGCRPYFTPTLTGLHQTPDAVTFTAMQGGGYTCTLTVPRGALLSLTTSASHDPGQPVRLTITDQQDGAADRETDARVFFFEVYPETPEGAACLEALGTTDRVGPPDTEA
jgi:hypothetical protein